MKKITKLISSAMILAVMATTVACGSVSEKEEPQASENDGGGTTVEENIGFVEDETLTLVVPGKPGGGSDLAIRHYSEALTRLFGLTTTVTNYDSNTIGHQTLATAKPDGTTLTLATSALNVQYITGNSEINPMEDFTLIAAMQDNGFAAIAVPADAPYDDFNGFVEYAKANPGTINAGQPSSGNNTFMFAMMEDTLGIDLNAVEAASESDRLVNLSGGFIDVGFVGIGNAREYEKAGKLKVIGTIAADGKVIDNFDGTLPDNYKTTQEQGFEDIYWGVYHYLLGPAGMDQEMAEAMNASMKKVYDDPQTFEAIKNIGHIPEWHNLEESREIRQKEYDKIVKIADAMGANVR
ncbi:tripartite tricarboxylate transporter substrate binding protein [Proteiniclasticum sp. C24MP]|uniref:tripartite tricarboxylate transporter substrate binding protein n=1 Tax=Proteiniclasticum sp. C24MP TaxID=3374101 RepID=UPI003754D9EA